MATTTPAAFPPTPNASNGLASIRQTMLHPPTQGPSGSTQSSDEDQPTDELDWHALPDSNPILRPAGPISQQPTPSTTGADHDMVDVFNAPTPSEASHDHDYDALDNMSDGDESDFDPRAEEAFLKDSEQDLIQEFQTIEKRAELTGTVKTSFDLISPEIMPKDSNVTFEDDPFHGLSYQDPAHRMMLSEAIIDWAPGDLSAWRLPAAAASRGPIHDDSILSFDDRGNATPAQKRVRFRPALSETSDEDAAEAYPDLMDNVTPRNPAFMNSFETPTPLDGDSSDDSEEEYGNAMSFVTMVSHNDFESDDSGAGEESDNSSDSDSDDGETTDEDTPENEVERAEHVRRARALLRAEQTKLAPSTPQTGKRPSTSRSNSSGSMAMSQSAKPTTRIFPRDPTRAELTIDKNGVSLQSPSNPPEKDRAWWRMIKQRIGTPNGDPDAVVSWQRSASRSAKAPPKPFTCNQTLGNVFDGNLPVVNSSIGLNEGTPIADFLMEDAPSEASDDTEGHDVPSVLPFPMPAPEFSINDFIDDSLFNADADPRPSSSGVFSNQSDDILPSTPANRRGSTLESEPEDGMTSLSHLELKPSLVTSFRSNQDRARAIGALAINPIQRAETSERNAIQTNRRGAEHLPFSPARRRRHSNSLTGAGVTRSPRNTRRRMGSSVSLNPAAVAELQRSVLENASPAR